MSTSEMVDRFEVSRVSKSPAVFDPAKLEWLNGEHLRALPADQYADELLGYLEREGSPLAAQPDRVREVAPIVQEKLRELSQFEAFAGFLFGPVQMDPEASAKVAEDPEAPRALAAAADALEALGSWDIDSIEGALRSACEAVDLKPRVLFLPVRVAITGRTVAPGLFESLVLLGREESLTRIAAASRSFASGD